MKSIEFLSMLLMGIVQACSGPGEIRQWQPDFSNIRTYDWGEWEEKPPALAAFQNAYPGLDSLMKTTMGEELQNKGYGFDAWNPDFLVYYYFTVEELTTVRDRSGKFGVVTNMPEFREYQEGRLIIDFVRMNNMVMIWSGDAGDLIEESLAPEQRRKRIKYFIRKVFQEVPEVD